MGKLSASSEGVDPFACVCVSSSDISVSMFMGRFFEVYWRLRRELRRIMSSTLWEMSGYWSSAADSGVCASFL